MLYAVRMSNRKLARTVARAAPPSVEGERGPVAERPSPALLVAVRPASSEAPARLTVGPGDPPEHLFRRLLSAYLGGARSFEVVERPRPSPGTRDVVREFCRRTRGPEVVEDRGQVLELADHGDVAPDGLEDRLLQLGERVLRFHREAEESWDRLSFGDDGLWARKDDDVDREAWYLERCIALGEGRATGPRWSPTGAWTIARSLERIADHAVTLGEVGPRLADPGSDASLLRELRQFHQQAMAHLEEVLGSPDGSRANDLLDVGEALLAGGRALSERLLPSVGDGTMGPARAAAVARALEAIGRTVAYTQNIAQEFLDQPFLRLPRAADGRAGLPNPLPTD